MNDSFVTLEDGRLEIRDANCPVTLGVYSEKLDKAGDYSCFESVDSLVC